MTRLLLSEELFPGAEVVVSGEEFKYLCRVRRHREGDLIDAVDGGGNFYRAIIQTLKQRSAVLQIQVLIREAVAPLPVHLFVAVPKRTLFEDVVRRVNEMGIERITPLISARTQVTPGNAKVERWRKIAAESSRQCGRSHPVIVDDAVAFDKMSDGLAKGGTRLIFHPGGTSVPAGALLKDRVTSPLYILVGPEGGFSSDEVECAVSLKFQQVRFGEYILRIETAAVAAAFLAITLVGGLD